MGTEQIHEPDFKYMLKYTPYGSAKTLPPIATYYRVQNQLRRASVATPTPLVEFAYEHLAELFKIATSHLYPLGCVVSNHYDDCGGTLEQGQTTKTLMIDFFFGGCGDPTRIPCFQLRYSTNNLKERPVTAIDGKKQKHAMASSQMSPFLLIDPNETNYDLLWMGKVIATSTPFLTLQGSVQNTLATTCTARKTKLLTFDYALHDNCTSFKAVAVGITVDFVLYKPLLSLDVLNAYASECNYGFFRNSDNAKKKLEECNKAATAAGNDIKDPTDY